MPEPESYSYQRYLVAKQTVDARALNLRVWQRFVTKLAETDSPLQVLEIGAGIGATAQRVLEAVPTRFDQLEYTLLDVNSANLAVSRKRLRDWLEQHEHWSLKEEGEEVTATKEGGVVVTLRFVEGDLFEYAATRSQQSYDALISQAVFDLLPVPATLDSLRPLLVDGGLWYLPIHFDGVTAFEPPIQSDLDDRIERLYHQSMRRDDAEEGGIAGAQTGRRLLSALPATGASLLEAGSSDWIVHPNENEYPSDEAYFLHHILHFVESELSGHPKLDANAFDSWLQRRREQIESGTLIYIAHQLDILAEQGG